MSAIKVVNFYFYFFSLEYWSYSPENPVGRERGRGKSVAVTELHDSWKVGRQTRTTDSTDIELNRYPCIVV